MAQHPGSRQCPAGWPRLVRHRTKFEETAGILLGVREGLDMALCTIDNTEPERFLLILRDRLAVELWA